MITEDYVSFETAKLLKEKGMDKSCFKHYVQKNNNDGTSEAVTVCTLQMAMKWLREVHRLFIFIGNDDLDYNWQIFDVKNRTRDLNPTCLTNSYAGYRKYEEACEAAVLYCLEHLI